MPLRRRLIRGSWLLVTRLRLWPVLRARSFPLWLPLLLAAGAGNVSLIIASILSGRRQYKDDREPREAEPLSELCCCLHLPSTPELVMDLPLHLAGLANHPAGLKQNPNRRLRTSPDPCRALAGRSLQSPEQPRQFVRLHVRRQRHFRLGA